MPTDFASVHAYLENAQAELHDSDPASRQMREAIGILMDAALKAQYSPQSRACEVLPFPGSQRTVSRPSSRHG